MMKHRPQYRPSERRGAAAVEYAIFLPIILFVFFGLWEYARVEMVRQATATACYDAARQGTLFGATTNAMDTAAQRILAIYSINGATITSTVTDSRSRCQIDVPIAENSWVALYIAQNRFISSECDFNRELFDAG